MTATLFAIVAVLAQAAAFATPPSLPSYVPPLTVLDDVLHLPPADAPVVQAGAVCYGPSAHLRLTLALQLGEALSNERARIAWLMGWDASAEKTATAFDAEHEQRLRSDAATTTTAARLQIAEQARWSVLEIVGTGGGVFLVGGLVGLLVAK